MKPETRRTLLGIALALSGVAGLLLTERGDWAMFAVILLGALVAEPKVVTDGMKAVSSAWRKRDA